MTQLTRQLQKEDIQYKARVAKVSTAQSIPTGTWTVLTFDYEDFDVGDMVDLSTNNDRITIKEDGVYLIIGQVAFDNNATGLRFISILKNGARIAEGGSGVADGSYDARVNASAMFEFTAGDYVQLQAWQNSGGDLNINNSNNFTWLAVYKLL